MESVYLFIEKKCEKTETKSLGLRTVQYLGLAVILPLSRCSAGSLQHREHTARMDLTGLLTNSKFDFA